MKRDIKRGLLIAVFLILSMIAVSALSVRYLSLSEPIVLYAEKGDVFQLDFAGDNYAIEITNFYTYSVEFQVSGKMNYFLLHEDESLTFNLDDFGENDLKITAQTIVPKKKATLKIEKINTQVPIIDAPPFKPVERTFDTVENETEESGTAVTEEEEEPEEEEPAVVPIMEHMPRDYSKIIYGVLIILGLAVIIGIIVYLKLASYAVVGVPPKLINYVKKAFALQTPIVDIQQNMRESGWDDNEIDLAIKHVQGTSEALSA